MRGGRLGPGRVMRWLALLVLGIGAMLGFKAGKLVRRARGRLPQPPALRLLGPSGAVSASRFAALKAGRGRIGPSDAAVTIVVFQTYGCGFCARLAPILDSLRQVFPRDLALVERSFLPTAVQPSLLWHLSVECAADQGRLAEYQAVLYRHLDLAGARGGWLQLADSAGVTDSARFYGCVRSQADRNRIERDTKLAHHLGVVGTPTMVINGTVIVGARTYIALVAAVTDLLAEHSQIGRVSSRSSNDTSQIRAGS
jgi:protein-disulfide isomerase